MTFSINVKHVTKEYKIFATPQQRLLFSFTKLKRFAPTIFKATDDVSIDIKKGEILGIVGKNGAGKSTLLKLITGVSFPTSGEIAITGRISSLLELGAGFNPELTGIENVYFQADLMGISKEEMDKRIPQIIEFADIGSYIEQPVKNYSSGMFARLAFATAINVDPDILIVDEVLSVGDIAFQFKCIEKMKEFAKQGVTIIFVTHSMMSLYRFCERAIWIDKGRVVMDGTVEEVVPRYEDDIKRTKATEEIEHLAQDNDFINVQQYSLLQKGKKIDKIPINSSFTFQVKYELLQDLTEEPYFALSITKDGLNYDMFGIYPAQERYSLPKKKGHYTLAVEFVDPKLNVSVYDIHFAIMEHNGIGQLYFGRALELEITGQLDTLGLVDIKHNITIKAENKVEK